MIKYKVNEIVYSLQGEGARLGFPQIFLRFSLCNLACTFCDTDFEKFTEMSDNDIINKLKEYPCKNIHLCGGEPSLQTDKNLIDKLHEAGYFISIETNGTNKLIDGIDYVVVSPKISNKKLHESFGDKVVDEIKYVLRKGQKFPKPSIKAKNYFISPIFSWTDVIQPNLEYCIELIKNQNFKEQNGIVWRLNTQNHKYWKIR